MRPNWLNLLVPFFSLALLSSPALAQTNWTRPPASGPGDWFTAGNWDNGVPTGLVQAFIDNGGTAQIAAPGASATSLLLGTAVGESGTLEVGATGTLSMSLFLSVAASGMGTVSITGGGTVSNGNGFIASNGGSIGMVTVSGAGSKWMNSGNLKVGDQGAATLNIMNGGVVTNVDGTVGTNSASISTVTVDGTGSAWTQTGDLNVGFAGTGTVNIQNGGVVSNAIGYIGRDAGSSGAVTVTSVVASWTNSGALYVGYGGTGTLDIQSGAKVSDTDGHIGFSAGSNGRVTVDNDLSQWMNSGSVTVGDSGTGTLNITNGGAVTNVDGIIASVAGSTGMVTVDGAGSTWTNSGNGGLKVGKAGNGTLTIQNGGVVTDFSGFIGNDSGSNGIVNVDGAGSLWTNTANVLVGAGGTGTLNITNGASVTNGADGIIGNVAGSIGTVNVNGAGSSWVTITFLNVGSGGTGTLNITNGGLVSNTSGFIGTFSGSTGTATVDGAGSTWTNTGPLSIGAGGTGTLNIINGGVVNATNTIIGTRGLLRGDATLNSPVSNSGVVAPGNNVGTLSLVGNYTQNANGTLQIEIAGLAPTQHDLLAVTGSASLDGTLQLLRLSPFAPQPGDSVTILTASGGRTGTFATIDSSGFNTVVMPTVVYNPNDVMVVFVQGSFAGIGDLTPNQQAVADNLDEAAGDPRAADLIFFLNTEPLGNLPHDYDLIAPEELASIYEIAFSQAVVTNNNLQHRMDDIRAGSTGFCANGYQARETGGYSKGADGKSTLDKNPTPAFVPTPENRWGVFVTGSGDFVNVGNHDDNAHGYDITTGNVIVGTDYRVGDHFAIGINGGYSGSTADLVDNGRVEVDGGKAGAYATVYGYKILGSIIHVDGAVSGGWNSYDTHRTGLEDSSVRGSTDGSEFNALLAYGGDWHFGCLLVGTWSSLQYTNVSIDSFTETGSLAPLHIENQDEYSLRGTTGARLAYDFKCGRAIVRPEVRAAWQHESGDRAYSIDARFASGAGDGFRVHGPAVGRDSALVDAGIAVQWSRCCSIYAYYDGVLGRSNYDNHAVSAGVRFDF